MNIVRAFLNRKVHDELFMKLPEELKIILQKK